MNDKDYEALKDCLLGTHQSIKKVRRDIHTVELRCSSYFQGDVYILSRILDREFFSYHEVMVIGEFIRDFNWSIISDTLNELKENTI